MKDYLHPRFHGNIATEHVVHGEAMAVQWLEGCGYTVTCRGTVLCVNEPWLSASPDGVLNTGELFEIQIDRYIDRKTIGNFIYPKGSSLSLRQ